MHHRTEIPHPSVLRDARLQLEVAARRLKAIENLPRLEGKQPRDARIATQWLSEAVANIHAAEARIR